MSETNPAPEAVTLDLSAPAGFPLRLELPTDMSDPELIVPEGIEVADMPILARSLRGMVQDESAVSDGDTLGTVFMLSGVAEPVTTLKANGLEVGVTVLLPGTVGGEWNRTPGYAVPQNPVLLEVWQGSGVLYLQDPVGRDLIQVFHIALSPGTVAIAPPGWAYQVSNTGIEPLVFAEFDSDISQAASDPLESLKGMAHFILKPASGTAGGFDLAGNQEYTTVPTPRAVAPDGFPALGLTQGKPFLQALKADPTAFQWLTSPAAFEEVGTALYTDGNTPL